MPSTPPLLLQSRDNESLLSIIQFSHCSQTISCLIVNQWAQFVKYCLPNGRNEFDIQYIYSSNNNSNQSPINLFIENGCKLCMENNTKIFVLTFSRAQKLINQFRPQISGTNVYKEYEKYANKQMVQGLSIMLTRLYYLVGYSNVEFTRISNYFYLQLFRPFIYEKWFAI